jgi:hypothetical protein
MGSHSFRSAILEIPARNFDLRRTELASGDMTVNENTQPLMAKLRALRKQKIQIRLFGESARASKGKDEFVAVDVYDLVSRYATGQLSLDHLVA